MRDFLRLVATAPAEEHEVRLYLWYADFFHILDLYEEGYAAFRQAAAAAERGGSDITAILADFRLTRGHFLLHNNDPAGAKDAFLEDSRKKGAGPFMKANCLFGAAEIEIFCGDTAPQYAPARLAQALALCENADPAGENADVQELRADILRRTGTIHRLSGRLDEAEAWYDRAGAIYSDDMVRGLVWLAPERAELLRARAFSAPAGDAGTFLAGAAAAYEEAKAKAQRIRNINWFAHNLLGECETARIAFQHTGKSLPADIDTKYANAFEIYCQISSHWGIVQTFISEALLYHAAPEVFPDKYAVTADKLEQAGRFGRELGLKNETALIARIKSRREPVRELHPLTFL